MHNKDILTIDVDWASDDIINDVANYLIQKNVKATWFITHDSNAVQKLKDRPDLFERGIHPNFFKGSSHGETEEEVLEFCMNIVPESLSSRSHGVYHHGRLLNYMVENTPIKIDTTTFLPEMKGLYPVRQKLPAGEIIKAPFFWADDYEICLDKPFKEMNRLYDVQGLRIYMFHPIHIALNTQSMDGYNTTRNNPELQKKLEDYSENNGVGVTKMFIDLVEHLSLNGGGHMLKSILS